MRWIHLNLNSVSVIFNYKTMYK